MAKKYKLIFQLLDDDTKEPLFEMMESKFTFSDEVHGDLSGLRAFLLEEPGRDMPNWLAWFDRKFKIIHPVSEMCDAVGVIVSRYMRYAILGREIGVEPSAAAEMIYPPKKEDKRADQSLHANG